MRLLAVHGKEHLARLLLLKKGVFEVALLFVHSTNVITGRGHVRVLGAEHSRLDLERPLELKKGVFEVALP